MSKSIAKEILIPEPQESVWRAISSSTALADWTFPNDFEPTVGHRFTFRVSPNPAVNFEGLVIDCEVLECEPPTKLVFSWNAGEPVTDTRVRFTLEPIGEGTRLIFEHAGFNFTHPFGNQAFQGAEFGWTKMLRQLVAVVQRSA